jgi:4-amino-4-deoxy-L-arabinose transferase-like glycosyltransferase
MKRPLPFSLQPLAFSILPLLFLLSRCLLRLTSPFTDVVDFNAAVWSQAAHNFLRAGLGAGVPAGFYFGPLPIPADSYYVHHPSLLPLVLAGAFRLLGEHEWVARLIPAISSLISVPLLWVIVRDCRGPRAATFAAALFVAMPMELHYGLMVNFEPCTLAALLCGLLGQLRWEREEDAAREQNPAGFTLMVGGYFLALCSAWLGYFFVVAIATHLLFAGRRRGGGLLIVLALLSGAIFLFQIRLASPAAWNNLSHAFLLRLGHSTASGEHIPFGAWAVRVLESLFTHILWPSWLLALGGVFLLIRGRHHPPTAWLARVCLIFFAMDAFYIGAFRNASYIHNYSAFYFILPVAICGGIALDAAAAWLDLRLRLAGSIAALILCIFLCVTGWRAADRLLGQAYLLETDDPEPDDLIVQLGRLIRTEFPPDATVFTNFDYGYTPQLSYYAQRRILNNLTYDIYWQDAVKAPGHLGGLIWAGDPDAREVLAVLNPATLRPIQIEALKFYIWNPASPP